LQGNPQLWAVAGDLFVKNMDWPGAQEMAARFAKTIDPKLLGDDDKTPELQAAEQQIQVMGRELVARRPAKSVWIWFRFHICNLIESISH